MNIKWNFLLLALLAVASISWIGISIAEQSIAGVIISILALFIIMGYGFSLKRKMRQKGKL
ncbi:YlaF family protein [Actinomycetes bacterium NPDC127524]|uniref:YlaF family protein n=1 Tax=Bacillus sp. MUM 13 TaxID=1678001 RepID=UPI0008F57AFA|nr:YlaF family protein [Bacillus sp. MUM 13]OIK09040.1 hypothetical protein BIV59_18045 [Bacillus sp. MUM 13]